MEREVYTREFVYPTRYCAVTQTTSTCRHCTCPRTYGSLNQCVPVVDPNLIRTGTRKPYPYGDTYPRQTKCQSNFQTDSIRSLTPRVQPNKTAVQKLINHTYSKENCHYHFRFSGYNCSLPLSILEILDLKKKKKQETISSDSTFVLRNERLPQRKILPVWG